MVVGRCLVTVPDPERCAATTTAGRRCARRYHHIIGGERLCNLHTRVATRRYPSLPASTTAWAGSSADAGARCVADLLQKKTDLDWLIASLLKHYGVEPLTHEQLDEKGVPR